MVSRSALLIIIAVAIAAIAADVEKAGGPRRADGEGNDFGPGHLSSDRAGISFLIPATEEGTERLLETFGKEERL